MNSCVKLIISCIHWIQKQINHAKNYKLINSRVVHKANYQYNKMHIEFLDNITMNCAKKLLFTFGIKILLYYSIEIYLIKIGYKIIVIKLLLFI